MTFKFTSSFFDGSLPALLNNFATSLLPCNASILSSTLSPFGFTTEMTLLEAPICAPPPVNVY
jgi:hypothetical protein